MTEPETNNLTVVQQIGEGQIVPESMPERKIEPTSRRRVHFVAGFLLYPFFPGRVGPHLIQRSWFAAILAHYLALLIGIIAWMMASGLKRDLFQRADADLPILEIRMWIVSRIKNAILESSGIASYDWSIQLFYYCSPLFTLLIAIAFGSLMWPWAFSEDGRRNAWRRSVKNALWITTIPMMGVVTYLILIVWGFRYRGWLEYADFDEIFLYGILPSAYILLFIRATVRGVAGNFVVSDEDVEPRMPRCEECGYVLVGLFVNSKCPECGTPISESFGDSRRTHLAAEVEQTGFTKLFKSMRMLRRLNKDRNLYKQLPVYRPDLAVRIWSLSFWMSLVPALAALLWMANPLMRHDRDPFWVFLYVVPSVYFLTHSLMLLNLVWLGRARHGITDPRICFSVGHFAAPLLIPSVLIASFGPALLTWWDAIDKQQWILPYRDYIWVGSILALVSFFILYTAWWISCTRFGLHHSRYSNY